MSAHRALYDNHRAGNLHQILDPGDAGTIKVDRSPAYVGLVSATAETRTLARPDAVGDILEIQMATDGGDITLTVTGGYNEAGDTTFTFSDPGQFATFTSAYDGTNYFWRLTSHYGMGNASPTEFGALNGLTATVDEINAVADVSARLVDVTAASLTITAASHGDKIVLLDSTHTQTITLPQATGSGNKYVFIVKTKGTDGSKVIQVANTTDIVQGFSIIAQTDTTQVNGFITTATDDTVTLNNTTKGGFVGDTITIVDIASGVFSVKIEGSASGTVATPFSAAV